MPGVAPRASACSRGEALKLRARARVSFIHFGETIGFRRDESDARGFVSRRRDERGAEEGGVVASRRDPREARAMSSRVVSCSA